MDRRAWGGVVAALCACLIGLGLARFAYTPLIPALIAARWFSPDQAVYLGAANLGGYLAGALAARPLARWCGARAVLRGCMVLAGASLLACAHRAGFGWFVFWRAVSGMTGAGLMVLAAPAVMRLVPPGRRGLAGGVIFTGVGIGIAASGTLLPRLLESGLPLAWNGLAAAAFAATLVAWLLLPPDAPRHDGERAGGMAGSLWAMCAAYGISAAGQVPTMLFLADFVARTLHRGVAGGALVWAVFGLGALAGPLLAGLALDRIGAVAGLRWLWASQCVANGVLMLVAWGGPGQAGLAGRGAMLAIWGAAAVAGAGIPGLVVLVLGRSQALAGESDAARGHAWSRATAVFALGQAMGAYGLSFLFAQGLGHGGLFAAGVGAMACGFFAGELSRGLARKEGLFF